MRIIVLGMLIFFFQVSWSQNNEAAGIPKEGTYQIIVKDSKVHPVFTKEVLKGTEAKRKEDENVSIQIDDNTFLFLPSRKEIASKEFEKLEPVSYE